MAGWRETDTLEPIDETPLSGVSELPGRNGSERESKKHGVNRALRVLSRLEKTLGLGLNIGF
jgi:hypothetical protein